MSASNPSCPRGILVYMELEYSHWSSLSLELLGTAHQLAAKHSEPVYVAYIGAAPVDPIHKLSQTLAADQFIAVIDQQLTTFFANTYSQALIHCIKKCQPSTVLIGATPTGKSIAPMAASYFSTGLTADCTELDWDENGNLIQIRPAFGGNVLAKIITPDTRPQFATVRAGVMSTTIKTNPNPPAFIIESLPESAFSALTQIKFLEQKITPMQEKLSDANVIVAVGRGFAKKEDLLLAQQLADRLEGRLASSRALVEKGWMNPSQQIGLSGHAVSPALLITLGISGSVQFMAGASGAKTLIAINNDPTSPILQEAHLPICTDLYDVLPQLIEQLPMKQNHSQKQ